MGFQYLIRSPTFAPLVWISYELDYDTTCFKVKPGFFFLSQRSTLIGYGLHTVSDNEGEGHYWLF